LEDEAKLKEVEENYKKGSMLTGEVKKILIDCLQKIIGEHQERRNKVTDEMVREYMKIRPLKFFSSEENKK